jgi:hypothetical protein
MNDPMTREGFRHAQKLVFACWLGNVSIERFDAMSIEEQVDFAEGNAHMSVDDLEQALRFLAAYHEVHAAALRKYADSHGHA